MQPQSLKRREFMTLLGTVAAWPLPLSAQQLTRLPRVGVLWPGSPPDKWDKSFRQGLHTLGYVEDRNILLEYRWAEGKQERLRSLAEELVGLKVDLIVTISAPAILAVKQATTTIPIVFAGTSDPVRTGFAASLAHPGGNLTGLSLMAPDLAGKRLEFITGRRLYGSSSQRREGGVARVGGHKRAEKTPDTWALGTRGADRRFGTPPSNSGHLWGPPSPRSTPPHSSAPYPSNRGR